MTNFNVYDGHWFEYTHRRPKNKLPNQTGSKQSGPQLLDTVATVTVTTTATVTDGETSPALNSQNLMIFSL